MNLSLKEFKQAQFEAIYLPGKPLYVQLFFRSFSFILTPLIAKLPVTPNMLTICSIIAGVLGAVFLMLPGTVCYLAGVLLVIVWFFLDILDGDLARFKRMESSQGVYLDYLGHYLVNPLIFSSFWVYLFMEFREPTFLGLGFISFVIHQYSRLATDVYNSVRYLKKVRDLSTVDPKHCDKLERIVSMLRVPGGYVFHAVNMSFIFGILRALVACKLYKLTLAIYILLILAASLGTSMIVLLYFNKLACKR